MQRMKIPNQNQNHKTLEDNPSSNKPVYVANILAEACHMPIEFLSGA
jgi:hypothetical protein